jgi:hypothetical protein
LETRSCELIDDVGLGFAETFAAGFAAFHVVIGEHFDVRPPGITVEVPRGLLGDRSSSERQENDKKKGFLRHRDRPSKPVTGAEA